MIFCPTHAAKNRICEFNLLLFFDDHEDTLVAVADHAQQVEAAKALKQGEWHSYTGVLVRQEEGPLRRFLIPTGHSRKSRYRKFQKYLNDGHAAVSVDFEMVQAALYSEAADEAEDLLPLAVHEFRRETIVQTPELL